MPLLFCFHHLEEKGKCTVNNIRKVEEINVASREIDETKVVNWDCGVYECTTQNKQGTHKTRTSVMTFRSKNFGTAFPPDTPCDRQKGSLLAHAKEVASRSEKFGPLGEFGEEGGKRWVKFLLSRYA